MHPLFACFIENSYYKGKRLYVSDEWKVNLPWMSDYSATVAQGYGKAVLLYIALCGLCFSASLASEAYGHTIIIYAGIIGKIFLGLLLQCSHCIQYGKNCDSYVCQDAYPHIGNAYTCQYQDQEFYAEC